MLESALGQHDRTGPFLFIDENQRSRPSTNRKAHSTRINRHVHRFFADRVREEKRAALEMSAQNTKLLVGWRSKPSPHHCQLLPLQRAASTSPVIGGFQGACLQPLPISEDGGIRQSRSREGSSDRAATDFPLLTANFSSGDSVDPFNCTAIPLKRQIQPILEYYISGFPIPGLFKVELALDPRTPAQRHRHFSSVVQVFRGCLSEKMHMYALLAFSAARMKMITKYSPFQHATTAECYLEKAIKSLRVFFASHTSPPPIDERHIIDVHCLCSFEWYFQNYEAAFIHLRVLERFIESLPRSSKLNNYIHEITRYQDVSISIETFTPPIIPLTWDTGYLPPERWQQMVDEISSASVLRMGRGFTEALAHGPLESRAFSSIIREELSPFLLVAQYTWLSFKCFPSDAEWMNQKAFALLHRLLFLSLVPQHQQNHQPSSLDQFQVRRREECCRIALIIVLSYICTTMAVVRSGRTNMLRLQKALVLVESFDESDLSWGPGRLHKELLLWVLVTGLSTTTMAGEKKKKKEKEPTTGIGPGTTEAGYDDDRRLQQPEQRWFLDRAANVASGQLGIETPAQLYTIMRRYFYFDALHTGGMEKLIRKLGV